MEGILLVDAGNSRLKWAHALAMGLAGSSSASYWPDGLKQVLDGEWSKVARPERILVASVAGESVNQTLREWVAAKWEAPVAFLIPCRSSHGVSNAYTIPQRLGADRWATLIAAHHRHRGPSCVVDCGTAVTIDAVADTGEHLGGLILPGLSMMREALQENTQGIGRVVSGDVSLLARNTADGVTAGTLYTLVAAIDRIVADVAAELDGKASFILTGGDARTLLPLLHDKWQYEPDLVLLGLAVIAGEGQPQ